MDQDKISTWVQLRYEELEVKERSCASDSAQLNKAILAEQAAKPADEGVKKALYKVDQDIVQNDKDILLKNAKSAFIKDLRQSKAQGGHGGPQGPLPPPGGGPLPGGGAPLPSSTGATTFPQRRMMGKLPEYTNLG